MDFIHLPDRSNDSERKHPVVQQTQRVISKERCGRKKLTAPLLTIKWKLYFQFKFSTVVKAEQNCKNLEEDTPVFALCLQRELFVLAKHAVSCRCQLRRCQNRSACFYCSYATHRSLELPSEIREISVLFSHPQTERLDGSVGTTLSLCIHVNHLAFQLETIYI